jgi:hypothetical protein
LKGKAIWRVLLGRPQGEHAKQASSGNKERDLTHASKK